MADYEEYCKTEFEALSIESKTLTTESPDTTEVIQSVLTTLSNIVSLASCTPAKVGESEEWTIVNAAQEDRAKLCEALRGKRLFSALYGVYCLTLNNLKKVLQKSTGRGTNKPPPTKDTDKDLDGFQEQKRRKRNISGEKQQLKTLKPESVPIRNYYAPLTTANMEVENGRVEKERPPPKGTGQPPPIILTNNRNLIMLQQEIETKIKEDFTLHNSRNGIRITTKDMEDYLAIKGHLDESKQPYYTNHPKADKPIKAVIRQLPGETPAEDIANELLALG
jgi:hypothetical protein